MRILAIETSVPPGSVALVDGTEVVSFQAIEAARKTTQAFALVIQSMLNQLGWSPDSINLVATTSGPGSFTGIRIGVTAAKVFAYSVGADVIGVNTLELIASQVRDAHSDVDAVLDAQRNQLFHARFAVEDESIREVRETEIVELAWLSEQDGECLLTGPALTRYRDRVSPSVRIAPEEVWVPQAGQLALLAARKHRQGHGTDAFQLVPQYYRKSAAEEKADGTGKG